MSNDMKKKIGILTLSASDNCGSLLQTYALQTVLKKVFYKDVEVINFSSEHSHGMYDIFPKGIYRNKRETIKRIINVKKLYKQKKGYMDFRKKYLQLSGRNEVFFENLENVCEKYDTIVIGSDQVWNVCMGDYSDAFFAPNVKCKKVAYAPSLGGNDLQKASHYCQIVEWIKEFSAISVRESKGKKCLENLLNKKVKLVLDPTLLLNKDDWKKLIGEPLIKEKYIFFYSWAYYDEKLNKLVQKEGERLGLKVYIIDASKLVKNRNKINGMELCAEEGPLAFLNLMYYSERCFVESFHGVIFAYIFKKNFWLLDKTPVLENIDTRLREILKQLQVTDRILSPSNYDKIDKDCEVLI